MSTEQERIDQQLSAAYRNQPVQSPRSLDERVLEMAQKRAPEPSGSRTGGWNWSPAWSGIAVVCVLALWLPALMESPAPMINSADFGDNVSVSESANLADAPAEAFAAARISASNSKSSADSLPAARTRRKQHSDSSLAGAASLESMPLSAGADAPMLSAAEVKPVDTLTSAAWLKRISELAASGDLAAAQAAFAEFRKVYPEVEVDATLLKRLLLTP